jgi:hypothetical protein
VTVGNIVIVEVTAAADGEHGCDPSQIQITLLDGQIAGTLHDDL